MSDFLITPHPVSNDVLLIDLSGVYWACYHATKNAPVSEAHDNTVAAVRRLREGRKYVVVCCDSGKSFRKEIYPEYKANREAKEPAAIAELRRACETLSKDGMHMWRVDGFEADDVIATATQEALKRGHTVTIASRDKDLMALVQPGVQQLAGADALMDEQAVRVKLGVPPGIVPDLLVLMGDASDNIPGVQGIGPVTAASLLNKYGHLDAVISAAKEAPAAMLGTKIGTSNKAVGQTLIDNLAAHAEYDIAKKLVALRTDVPLPPFEQLYEETKTQPLVERDPDQEEALDSNEDVKTPAPTVVLVPDNKQQSHPAQEKQKSIAIIPDRTLAAGQQWDRQLEPTSPNGALAMAKYLFDSRLFQRFGNPEAIWAAIILGRELGWGALTALNNIHVVEGKPLLHAHAIIARAMETPGCEYFQCVESSEQIATYECKKRGNPLPTRLTYTLSQAQAAGLVKPGSNWTKRPAEMLRKTCGVQLVRMEFPAAAMGLYCAEELGADYAEAA